MVPIPRILITDDCHLALIEGLEEMGYACDFVPEITPDKTLEQIPAYTGLIINSKILVNSVFIDRAENLKFIGRLGSGMEVVDRAYAAKKNVAVYSSPEGNRNAVAEQALGMLLALATNLIRADKELRSFTWRREANRGFELSGKTIGLIGFGHTGSQFAKKLNCMDMRILAYDKYKDNYTADFPWVEAVELEQIQAESDIISLHLPLTTETTHIFNAEFISKCQTGVILINTARGKCINTTDLVQALKTGKVSGACLDVFENEKTNTFTMAERDLYTQLYAMENVVLSPHIAGWTKESKLKMAQVLLYKIGVKHRLIN